MSGIRLAIVTTHPIQYYAPWFRHLAGTLPGAVRVFYLWDSGVKPTLDRGFGRTVQWDVPLLDGYKSEFVPNVSAEPGTHRFFGLRNPGLGDAVSRFDPDAVLLFGYRYASMARFVAKWNRRVPLIFRGDSHRIVAKPRTVRSFLERELLRYWFTKFAAFLYVGASNREYFETHGVPDSKLFFAPHSVDNERFARDAAARDADGRSWREELLIPADHRVILFAGKLEPKKRPLDLLRAFRDARPERATLLFAGNGPLEGELKQETAGDSRIRFAPFQNQTLMPRAYAAADLFVLPSFGSEETWGLAVNEAMAVGRAVVVSSHVGCARDLVRPRESGLIFRAGDVRALADALREALTDDERLREWGDSARRIVANYSYDAATAGLLRALDKVAGGLDR